MHENTVQVPTMHAPQESLRVPESTDRERIVLHPATLELVYTLLSGKRVNGGNVLLTLLAYATPGTGEDVALVEIQSVQQLSAQPHWPWGYTTTCKILLVLEAMGILKRHRHQCGVELRIHLGPPQRNRVQICQALDRLLQRKTPKVQRLAACVKKRLQQGNMLPESEFPSECCPAELQPVADYLQRLLEAYGVQIPQARRQELLQASQIIAHLLYPAISPAPPEGNRVGNLPLPQLPREHVYGETETPRGEFFVARKSRNPLEGISQSKPEPSLQARNRLAQAPMGNSEAFSDEEFPAKLENSPAEEQKGNSFFRTTLNVNRNILSEKEMNENVMRLENPFEEHEGNLLAMAVEGHAANAGAYRYYLAHYAPRTVLAAFIYLKQRQYGHQRRSIASPGAYFDTVLKAWGAFGSYEAACEAYHHARAKTHGSHLKEKYPQLPGIPAEVQELVYHFWGWPYDEVAATLQAQLAQSSRPKANVSPVWESQQNIPWLKGQNQQEPLYVPRQWMDRNEALCLMERIRKEAQTIPDLSLQLAPEPRPYRPRGTNQTVYLVDLVIERIPQVYAEPEQWHTYYHDVQACLSC